MVDEDQTRGSGVAESGPDTGGQPVAGAVKEAAGEVKEAPAKATEQVKEAPAKATEQVKEVPAKATEALPTDLKTVLRDAQRTVADEVKAGIAQAAAETVAPAARQAATSALVYATTKAPGLVQNVVQTAVVPKLKEAGGAKAIAGAALSKFPGAIGTIGKLPGGLLSGGLSKVSQVGRLGSMFGGGGKGGGAGGEELSGTGRGRRLPLQAAIDVSVPIEVAYNQWTQFEEFPKFMFRVERIEQKDDTHVIWHEKIWGVRRQWEAEIVEQRPNERIVWRSTSGPQNVGVVNFHRMHDPRLTRVQVNLDFQPTGLIEKTGRGWRAAIRALDTDLQRFKAFVEMEEAATGAWRGRVEDGEVRAEEAEGQPAEAEGQPAEAQPEQAQAEEERQAAQEREAPEAEEREAPEAEEREEPEAESDTQWQVRRRAPGRPSSSRR